MKPRRRPVSSPPPQARAALLWRFPAWIPGLLTLLWGALVLFFFVARTHWVPPAYVLATLDSFFGASFFHAYFFKAILSAAVALWIFWAALQGGRRLLALVAPRSSFTALETWALGPLLGLGAIAFLTFFLGAVHLWYDALFWGLLIGATLVFVFRPAPPLRIEAGGAPTPGRGLWVILLSLWAALLFWGDLQPEVFFDSLFYHLGVPNQFGLHHGLVNFDLLYASFVMTVQMVWGFAGALGGEIAVKVLHGGAAVLVGLLYGAYARRFATPAVGWIAAVLFLTMPLLSYNATTAGTDVAWTAFELGACFALARALSEDSRELLRLAGWLTGLSATCKYPAMAYIPLTGLVILWTRRREDARPWKEIGLDLLHFTAPALLVLSPYLLRNLLYHHNPLYPFGGVHWGVPRIAASHWLAFQGDAPARVWSQEFASVKQAMHFILHPWFITMEGRSSSDFVGPLWLMLLPLLLLSKRSTKPARLFIRIAGLGWILWLLTTGTPRYGLPVMALLAPLLAEALLALPTLRRTAFALVGAGAFANLVWTHVHLYGTDGWRVLGGLEPVASYLGSQHGTYPTPPYDAYAWINAHLPKDAKVLVIGDSRDYYLKRRAIPSSVYDPQPVLTYLEGRTPAQAAEAMRRDGVTHLFFNFGEAYRTRGYNLFPMSEATWKSLQEFWDRQLTLRWQAENPPQAEPKRLYVYELLSPEAAAAPHAAPPFPFAPWDPHGAP
jgi:hypothetical protein